MKDKQTPTTQVRDVLRRRSAVERFGLVFAGAVPTAETIAAGADVVSLPGRSWPLVEVADRTEEAPGGGFVMDRARLALRTVVNRGGSAIVFTHRRGYAPAFRCATCRTVRRCPACGARPGTEPQCPRCGATLGPCVECGGRRFEPLGAGAGRILEEVRRVVGAAAGDAASNSPVRVVTERDLVGVRAVDLAVVVDADGLLLAPHYRADEDALRLLARVAATVARGPGRRCLVQTGLPAHPVIAALRRGDAVSFLRGTVAERARDGFPPSGELLVVETGGEPPTADADLRAVAAGRATVLGPAPGPDRTRWLVQGSDLRTVRIALRRIATRWRETGARVRIDADPIDL
jgi:primosomal protein N' (replication factor Y)